DLDPVPHRRRSASVGEAVPGDEVVLHPVGGGAGPVGAAHVDAVVPVAHDGVVRDDVPDPGELEPDAVAFVRRGGRRTAVLRDDVAVDERVLGPAVGLHAVLVVRDEV